MTGVQTCALPICENVRKELNKIICKYAPGQEIKNVHNAVSNISLDTQNISDICMKHTSGIISKMLWAALGIFLFGIFSIIYQTIKYLIYRFKSEESRRKDICHELEKNESKIKAGIKTEERLRGEYNTFPNSDEKETSPDRVLSIMKDLSARFKLIGYLSPFSLLKVNVRFSLSAISILICSS